MDQGGGDDDDGDADDYAGGGDDADDDNADDADGGSDANDDEQVAATRMRVLQMIHPDWNVKKEQVVSFSLEGDLMGFALQGNFRGTFSELLRKEILWVFTSGNLKGTLREILRKEILWVLHFQGT